MSRRLDQEREKRLTPIRMERCLNTLGELGMENIEHDSIKIRFNYMNERVVHYVYSGWHTGKSIKDGRGFENLLKQIKN